MLQHFHKKSLKQTSLAVIMAFMCSGATASENTVIASPAVSVSEAELINVIAAMRMAKLIPTQELSTANVDKIAKDYYMYEVLAREARDSGFAKLPDVQKFLEVNQSRVLGTAYLNHYVTTLDMPEFIEAAREEYLLNQKRFVQPAQVNAQHILITAKDNENEDAAKQQAEKLYRELLKAPNRFEEYAEQYSNDPSAKNNKGNLGYFTADRMVPEFSTVAFALKKNQISKPVKTQFGWHIIKVVDSKPEKKLAFDEVKDQLIGKKQAEYLNSARNEKMQGILLDSEITVNEATLNDVARKANQKSQ